MLLCLSCKHFYQPGPVPEKMEPRQKFASHASYRPNGCVQRLRAQETRVRVVAMLTMLRATPKQPRSIRCLAWSFKATQGYTPFFSLS